MADKVYEVLCKGAIHINAKHYPEKNNNPRKTLTYLNASMLVWWMVKEKILKFLKFEIVSTKKNRFLFATLKKINLQAWYSKDLLNNYSSFAKEAL